MKRRIVYLSLSIVIAFTAAALLIFFSSQPDTALAKGIPGSQAAIPRQQTTIFARRLISVPFGIQDSLVMLNDHQVEVAGHGSCTADGTAFRLRTTVQQGTAKAIGYLQGDCNGADPLMWSTVASTNPAKTLQEGEAKACGMVVIYAPGKGAITKQWCKPVTLSAAAP